MENNLISSKRISPTQIFLCYCQKDARHAQLLQNHLAVVLETGQLAVWDESRILPGSLWQREIAIALETAQVAILLLSADFFASRFLATQELPALLAAAQTGGTRLLPVIVRPCLYEASPLAPFRPCNDPTRPLTRLPVPLREQMWVDLIRSIIHTS